MIWKLGTGIAVTSVIVVLAIANRVPTSAELEAAIETLATSDDHDAIRSALQTIQNGKLDAIAVLRRHLNETRIPVTNDLTPAVDGKPSFGTHCFWLIQGLIVPPTPKLYRDYETLREDNIEAWLDSNAGKSLLELQIVAATQSLDAARNGGSNSDSAKAVEFYAERLAALKLQ